MMGKRSNVIDIEIARAIKEAGLKPTAEVMEEVLDRIDKGLDKVPKENIVPFFKDLPLVKKVLGCAKASKLFSRLEYRFNIMPNGFYKFTAPCKNRYYRKGDSLCEEMDNISRISIWRISKKIATQYSSKALYESAKAELGEIGVFKGMPFLSYFDNKTYQTFFLRNKEVADLILEGKNPFKRKIFNRIKFPYGNVFRLLKLKNVICRTRQNVIRAHDKMSSPDVKNETCYKSENPKNEICSMFQHETYACFNLKHADVPEPAVYKASAPPTKNTYKEYSSSISPSEPEPLSEVIPQEPIREEEIKKVDLEEQPELDIQSEMVKVWTETTGREREKYQTKETVVNLERVFETKFNSSIQEWEKYCRLITSSKWLMGEIVSQKTGKGFNINLSWASKEENIDKIRGGEYTVGDRSNAVNIPLREPSHQDPYVLAFMRKALQVIGQAKYTAYMQPSYFEKTPRGEIIMRLPYAYTAKHVAQNDLLGLGSFIGSVGVPAVLICKPDGGMVGRIEARNGTIMNLRT